MDIRDPDKVITKQDLKNFYDQILPYLGGVPEGGETGQVLKKKSDQNGDVEWNYESGGGSGVPSGGITGQVLKKASNDDGDVVWANESGGGGANSHMYSVSEQEVGTWINGETIYETTVSAFVIDKNLTASSVLERELFSYSAVADGTISLYDMSCKTDTGSNDGYIRVLKNSDEISKSYIVTNVNTELESVTVPVSKGDKISVVTGWDNSHSNCIWQFQGKFSPNKFDKSNIRALLSETVIDDGSSTIGSMTFPHMYEIVNYTGRGTGGVVRNSIINITAEEEFEENTVTLESEDGTVISSTTIVNGSASITCPFIGTFYIKCLNITKRISIIVPGTYSFDIVNSIVYGFKIEKANTDPHTRFTYIEDAEGMAPASMDTKGEFNYGDWQDAFFMPKPCILNLDGTVQDYLNPNDMTKKSDGTSANLSPSNGNVMIEFPKVYLKFEDDGVYEYTYISNTRVDNSYHAYAFYDYNGNEIDNIYVGAYLATVNSYKLRSIQSSSTPAVNASALTYGSYAAAVNTSAEYKDYYIGEWSTRLMINSLIYLMIGNTDPKRTLMPAYNHSSTNNAEALNHSFPNNGLFSSDNSRVRVFGITDYFCNCHEYIAGLVYGTDSWYAKMTRSTVDGTTVSDYYLNIDSAKQDDIKANYIKLNIVPPNQGSGSNTYFSQMTSHPIAGRVASASGGSDSTYDCAGHMLYQQYSSVLSFGGGFSSNNGVIHPYGHMALGRTESYRGARLYCKPCVRHE